MRGNIKRLYEIDKDNKIKNTYINKESIESKIIEYNAKHFTKAHQTIAYKDKIYAQLNDNKIRDKILNREL